MTEELLTTEGLLRVAGSLSDGKVTEASGCGEVLVSLGGWEICADGCVRDPGYGLRCVGLIPAMTSWLVPLSLAERGPAVEQYNAARAVALAVQLATDPKKLDRIAGDG